MSFVSLPRLIERSLLRWLPSLAAAALLGISCGCALHRHKQVGASMLDDKVTADRVEAALRAGPKELKAVQVKSCGGVVILSGVVPSEEARERAMQLAKSVHRATMVADHLQVRR